MTSPLIRAARPHDIPAITRIYAHAVTHGTASFELEPPDEAEMLRRQTALLEGGYPYLVAESDGALAGYAYAGAYRTRPAYRWSVEDSIYVDPDAQRRGIGRILLDRLVADAERRGFRQMMFSKIMPNLKRLGLLTPRVRAAYEKLDLLRFENDKDSVEDPEVTPPQELVELLMNLMQSTASAGRQPAVAQ